jgi:hypothetical protein
MCANPLCSADFEVSSWLDPRYCTENCRRVDVGRRIELAAAAVLPRDTDPVRLTTHQSVSFGFSPTAEMRAAFGVDEPAPPTTRRPSLWRRIRRRWTRHGSGTP